MNSLEIEKVKEKAEKYLYKIVNDSWNNLTNLEKDDYIPLNWPIQFDAHVYLGNKYKNLIPGYAVKIRSLWLNWMKWYESKDNGYKRFKFFWPVEDEFLIPIDHESAESDSGHEIESHIVMCRAKENLQISGFDSYFNEAKRRLGELLIEDRSYNEKKIRILWQTIRCPYLSMLLQDYMKTLTLKIFEDKNINEIHKNENNDFFFNVNFLSKMSFFLTISKYEKKYGDAALNILKKYMDIQEENGSFFNDIIMTCLIISAIELSGLDRFKIVSKPAIEWLLNEQTPQGSWPHPQISWSYITPELDILSTVLVLETIDIVTSNRVLPIWAEKLTIHKPITQDIKYTRIKTIVPFQTPKGINWHDVSIRFVSEEAVQIRAGSVSEGRDFKVMGFEFRDLNRPDLIWEALKEFGKHQGEISFYDNDIDPQIKRNLKYNVHAIKERLEALFGIKNPFYSYNRKKKLYKTKFNIKYDA